MAQNMAKKILEEFQPYVLAGATVTKNELGRGSYAMVVEIRYRGLKCAGKRLHSVLYETGIGHAAKRYVEECRILTQTRHPHIVQFIGVFFEEGSQFPILVMEFLPTNLYNCLDQYGILSDEISYSILHDVSLGLSYLHGQTPPIVHRDLSANNVLLSKDMTAKISDLGLAKILDIAAQQRMTETPGTQAYMPPEVMTTNPHYGVSVDKFSFGALMVHVFTAEWPDPKLPQTRVDPANSSKLLPVTEVERREYFLHKIGQDHPLMDLITRCLSNNPSLRPHILELVGRISDLVLRFPPSFENRVEMLRRISADSEEKRRLEQEAKEKEREIAAIREDAASVQQEKEKQQQEYQDELEKITLAYSIEVQNLKLLLADKEHEVRLKNDHLVEMNDQLVEMNNRHETEVTSFDKQVAGLKEAIRVKNDEIHSITSKMAQLKSDLSSKEEAISLNDMEMESLHSRLKCLQIDATALAEKDTTINGLSSQLTSCSCRLSQVKATASCGQSVLIGEQLYYGSGEQDLHVPIYSYNVKNNQWSPLSQHPVTRFGLGQIEGKLVTVGGTQHRSTTPLGKLYQYSNDSWEDRGTPMLTARIHPTVVSHQSHLIVAGGKTDSGLISHIEIYSAIDSRWNQVTSLPKCCTALSGGVHNGIVYLIGGRDESERSKRVFAVAIDKIQDQKPWREIPDTPTYWPFALISSRMILTAGGCKNATLTSKSNVADVYGFSFLRNSWVRIGVLPAALVGVTAAAISPTEFLIIGGVDINGKNVKTVYEVSISTVY